MDLGSCIIYSSYFNAISAVISGLIVGLVGYKLGLRKHEYISLIFHAIFTNVLFVVTNCYF
jgi:hypothetical protein